MREEFDRAGRPGLRGKLHRDRGIVRDDTSLANGPWLRDLGATWEHWREAGADGAVILARSVADVDALVAATERW